MKKTNIVKAFLCLLLVLFVALVAPSKAQAEGEAPKYEVVKDGETFKGINLKADLLGSFKLNIVKNGYVKTTTYAPTLTIDLTGHEIDKATTTGFAIKLQCIGSNLTKPRVTVEMADGTIWRLWQGNSIAYKWINNDGTAGADIVNNNGFAFTAGAFGTLSYNWEAGQIKLIGADGGSTQVQKIHIGIDTRAGSLAGCGLAIAAVGSYTINGSDVSCNVIYETKDFTYATSAEDTTSDVNPFDVTKGSKIRFQDCHKYADNTYCRQTGDCATEFNSALPNFIMTKVYHQMTIKYVDQDDVQIKDDEIMDCVNNAYSITPATIQYYEYASASKALTGTVTGDDSIILKYNCTKPVLTIKYVDGEGHTINAETKSFKDPDSQYTVETPAISGFEYKSCTDALTGTITESKTITLVYELTNKGEGYKAVYGEDGSFKGVNLTSEVLGAFSVKVKEEGFVQSADWSAMIAIDLGAKAFDKVNTAGFALKLACHGANIANSRLYMVMDDGSFYRLWTGDSISYNFISEDGTITPITNKNNIALGDGFLGTLNYVWSTNQVKFIAGDQSSSVVKQIIIAFDTRKAACAGMGIEIMSVATFNEDNEISVIFDSHTLTYGTDATSGVNTADISKGTAIKYLGLVGFAKSNERPTENAEIESIKQQLSFSRVSNKVTITYKDEQGTALKNSEVKEFYVKDAAYSVTAPEITGYTFKQDSAALTGTVSADMELNLVYSLNAYKVTIKFVDADGKQIQADEVIDVHFNDAFEYTLKVINGYEFKEADKALQSTIEDDLVITLTYTKKASGCGSFVTPTLAISSLLVSLAFVLRKKEEN